MSKYQSFNSKGGGTQAESVKELFHQNEIQANKLVTLTMLLLSAGLIIAWVLNILGVFLLDRLFLTIFVGISVICFGIAALINQKFIETPIDIPTGATTLTSTTVVWETGWHVALCFCI